MPTENNTGMRRVGDGDIRPVPDPTVLTTQQLVREIAALREILEAQIKGEATVLGARLSGEKSTLETRLAGMDKAIDLAKQSFDKQPGIIDDKIHGLQTLHEEKFRSIATQFAERDTRTEQTQRDSKVAVDAALQAQKESVNAQNISNAQAIAKSEANFTKLLDQLAMLINSNTKTSDDKIDDLKERLTSIESRGQGSKETKEDSKAWIAIGISLVTGALLLASMLFPHAPTTVYVPAQPTTVQPTTVQPTTVQPTPR